MSKKFLDENNGAHLRMIPFKALVTGKLGMRPVRYSFSYEFETNSINLQFFTPKAKHRFKLDEIRL